MKEICLWIMGVLFVFAVTNLGSASSEPLTVTDMAGRVVTVPANSQRIACLGPGALRLIVYLKAENLVVGVEELERLQAGGRPYALAHPEFAALPRIGPGGASGINQKPDMEALLSVQPQVIFVTYMDPPLMDEVQKTLGIPIVALSYGRLATFDEMVFDSLRLAGKILGRDARAQEVVDFTESLRRDLQRRTENIPPDHRPKVYVGGIGHRGAHGIESTEQQYIPLLWVNAVNAADSAEAKLGSHVFMDKEQLLVLNPDVIFIDAAGLTLILEDYRKKPSFYEQLGAFKAHRIYTLFPFNSYTTNIETALADAYAVGKVLYPEHFSDIDPEKMADTIYTFFVSRPVYEAMKNIYGPIGFLTPFWKKPGTVEAGP